MPTNPHQDELERLTQEIVNYEGIDSGLDRLLDRAAHLSERRDTWNNRTYGGEAERLSPEHQTIPQEGPAQAYENTDPQTIPQSDPSLNYGENGEVWWTDSEGNQTTFTDIPRIELEMPPTTDQEGWTQADPSPQRTPLPGTGGSARTRPSSPRTSAGASVPPPPLPPDFLTRRPGYGPEWPGLSIITGGPAAFGSWLGSGVDHVTSPFFDATIARIPGVRRVLQPLRNPGRHASGPLRGLHQNLGLPLLGHGDPLQAGRNLVEEGYGQVGGMLAYTFDNITITFTRNSTASERLDAIGNLYRFRGGITPRDLVVPNSLRGLPNNPAQVPNDRFND